MTMNKAEFERLLREGASVEAAAPGKADWDTIIKEATKDGKPYTNSQFYAKYINGTVSPQRAKNKLKELFQMKQVARIYRNGMYFYCFHPDVVKAQHGG